MLYLQVELSLFINAKLDKDISMMLSSIAGHFAINTVANKNFVEFDKLKNSLLNLLKVNEKKILLCQLLDVHPGFIGQSYDRLSS